MFSVEASPVRGADSAGFGRGAGQAACEEVGVYAICCFLRYGFSQAVPLRTHALHEEDPAPRTVHVHDTGDASATGSLHADRGGRTSAGDLEWKEVEEFLLTRDDEA
ncbi:hypothetical protein EDD27_3869 [Nonomuraea polychroma]|uniref:Uncharacterized protein n=1 Tax=Nonomuraea polychroma TaxID=46176 RepID=A0A438M6L7_9ACTN|nr:hypothetical protein EDD27_3869 [Nonomuraea polychroma]